MWRFWSLGVVHKFTEMADSSKWMLGLFYLIDTVKGKEISIFISPEQTQNPKRLIGSVIRRCEAVVDARGGHTRYWTSQTSIQHDNFCLSMICSVDDVKKFCWYCYAHMNLNYTIFVDFFLYVKTFEHQTLVSFLLLTSIYLSVDCCHRGFINIYLSVDCCHRGFINIYLSGDCCHRGFKNIYLSGDCCHRGFKNIYLASNLFIVKVRT